MKKSRIDTLIFTMVIIVMLFTGCGNNISQGDTNEIIGTISETVVEEEKSIKSETTVEEMNAISNETIVETVDGKNNEMQVENEENTDNEMVNETLVSAVEENDTYASDDDSVSVKNVPVGTNPEIMPWGSGNKHRYVFTDESWVEMPMDENGYMAETADEYGITYIEYRQGANEIAMDKVAEFVQENPESNLADIITKHGNEIVVVTSWLGLWDDTYDYEWYWNIVECEPEECLYMLVAGNIFDPGYDMASVWNKLFTSVSDNLTND